MRILMVTRETAPDRRYGLGRSLMPVVEALRALGHDSRYFCQDDLGAAQLAQREQWWDRIRGIGLLARRPHVLALARAWLERLQVGAAAAGVARQEGYTHVHAHDPWIAAGVAWRLRRDRGPRIAWGVTQHGFGSYARATQADGLVQGPALQRWLHRIEAAILARAAWVIAPSQSALDALAQDLRMKAKPAHWHVVPHARPPIAPATPGARAVAREGRGWNDANFVVVSIGRLAPIKCFERVIEACAQQEDARLRLVILGGGDGAALLQCARDAGFGSQITIECVDDVAPWLHAADLYVSASASESFGMANLEALCAGVPPVCSAVGAVPEVMGEAAWLVPNDTASLARAIAALRNDEAARQEASRRGIERAAGWPDAQAIARMYVDVYRSAPAKA
jgi:glycosyltransferase involved in cell wall biosynthesis